MNKKDLIKTTTTVGLAIVVGKYFYKKHLKNKIWSEIYDKLADFNGIMASRSIIRIAKKTKTFYIPVECREDLDKLSVNDLRQILLYIKIIKKTRDSWGD